MTFVKNFFFLIASVALAGLFSHFFGSLVKSGAVGFMLFTTTASVAMCFFGARMVGRHFFGDV